MDEGKGANDSANATAVGVFWWVYLITAVLAVPSLAFLVTKVMPVNGMLELLIFVVACWLCTYTGMRLMTPSRKSDTGEK